MGSFFLSGAMPYAALNRKGRRAFLRSKRLKLGVPVVVYAVLGPPMLSSFLKLMRGEKLNVRDLVALEGAERCQGTSVVTSLVLVFDTAYSFPPRSSLEHLARMTSLPVFCTRTHLSTRSTLEVAGRICSLCITRFGMKRRDTSLRPQFWIFSGLQGC
jgi:hypothetical protein